MSLVKKIFISSTILLAVLLLFWGIYVLSFKKPTAPENFSPQDKAASPSAIPARTEQKIITISDEPVLAPVINDSLGITYYSKENGKVYQIDFDGGNKKAISTKELPGLSEVFWSPDRTKVITHFSKDGRNKFYYFNYIENRGVPLKDNLDTLAWQNNGKIFYKYFEPRSKKRTLDIASPDGTDWKDITDLEFRSINIAPIPKTGLVSFWNMPDAWAETSLQSIPVVGGEKRLLFSGKFGADYLWSPDGSAILVSHSDAKAGAKMQLASINDRGGEYRNLDMPTMVSKCVWSKDNKNIFCALPGSIPANAILPNDYLAGKFKTADTFWRINTATGEKTRLIDLDKIHGEFDTSGLFLTSDESLLFFVNKSDGKLYRIDL